MGGRGVFLGRWPWLPHYAASQLTVREVQNFSGVSVSDVQRWDGFVVAVWSNGTGGGTPPLRLWGVRDV